MSSASSGAANGNGNVDSFSFRKAYGANAVRNLADTQEAKSLEARAVMWRGELRQLRQETASACQQLAQAHAQLRARSKEDAKSYSLLDDGLTVEAIE